MGIKTLAIAITRLRRPAALAVAGAVIAVLGMPVVSAAASAPYPVCGGIPDNLHHCYVEAVFSYPGGNPDITSMAGEFTAPRTLKVPKDGAYSIAQIALEWGYGDIELGWIVDPKIYGDQSPHLFAFFRYLGGACEEGIPHQTTPLCPLNNDGYVPLKSTYHAGMAIGGTPAFFYVGFDSQDNFWYIQYQDQYFAKMNSYWWYEQQKLAFAGGDTAFWFGEVYTPSASDACTAMGNGVLGSDPGSATITDMLYGTGGPTLLPASPIMDAPTWPQYWDSSRATDTTFSSSFSFGGPGDCT
jgi:hypothetical protein